MNILSPAQQRAIKNRIVDSDPMSAGTFILTATQGTIKALINKGIIEEAERDEYSYTDSAYYNWGRIRMPKKINYSVVRYRLVNEPIKTRKQLAALAVNGVIKRNGISVRIYEDGTILRNDIRVDLAKPMTVRETVKLLGL